MPTWGRGGAGNILTEEQVRNKNEKLLEDPEANRSLASNAAPPPTSSPVHAPSPQEYAHMGRGGAGNWYQPSELDKQGSFTQPSDSTAVPTSPKPDISKPWHPEGQEMPVARTGRGGAGNFVWNDGEKEKRMREEEEKRMEKVNEKVERDVEVGLQKPGAVVLGGVKAGRGW